MADADFQAGWNAACRAIATMLREEAKRAAERDTKNGRRLAGVYRTAARYAQMARLDLPMGRRLRHAAQIEAAREQSIRDTGAEDA